MDQCPNDAFVVNCTKDLPMRTESGHRLAANDDRSAQANADMREHLPRAVAEIAGALARSQQVYVHCVAGRYRSPTVVVAFLVKHGGMDLEAAIRHVQECKRDAFFYEHHFMGVLSDFCRSVRL
jgi:predicted protein tyrosine phosphatase